MKTLSTVIITCLFFVSCRQKNYIYIVRHAEKSTEPSGDVYLTQQGRQRANALKSILQHKNLDYIFSTKYNRTRETATPISSESGVPINMYNNDTLAKFVKRLLRFKSNMLVVGHSNTVITMLDSMHVEHSIKNIAENDYDNLFIITQKKGKVIKLKETTYGKSSPDANAAKNTTGSMIK